MNLKYWIIGLLMLPLLAACSDEDDVDAIFMGRTWKLTTIMQNNKSIYEPTSDEQKEISESARESYIITFTDKVFSGKTLNDAFNGTWSVDGKKHEIHFTFKNTPNPPGAVSKKMIEILQNATKYEGDTNQMTIRQASGPYLLLMPLK
jgi:hypothetical protein